MFLKIQICEIIVNPWIGWEWNGNGLRMAAVGGSERNRTSTYLSYLSVKIQITNEKRAINSHIPTQMLNSANWSVLAVCCSPQMFRESIKSILAIHSHTPLSAAENNMRRKTKNIISEFFPAFQLLS